MPESAERGPFLHIAAFWLATVETDAVAAALRESDFSTPEGWPRGFVVSFPRDVATLTTFKDVLRRLDLEELTATP